MNTVSRRPSRGLPHEKGRLNMEKYTQRQLKNLVRTGAAVDVSNADNAERAATESREGYYTQIGYAEGVYGCSGKLLLGNKTGTLYAVTSRTQAIYIFLAGVLEKMNDVTGLVFCAFLVLVLILEKTGLVRP